MKRFFIKSSTVVLTVVISFYLFFRYTQKVTYSSKMKTMAGAVVDKHKRLSIISTPKIILVGGSNVMFGYNSVFMEKKLKMPVQNMALAAGLGLSFMLNEIKNNAEKGDIVILSSEYFLTEGDDNLKLLLAELYPPAASYIDYPNFYEKLKINCNYIIRSLRSYLLIYLFSQEEKQSEDVYTRKSFNAHGDILEKIRINTKGILKDSSYLTSQDYSESISKINHWADNLKKKGVRVFYIFPVFAEGQFKINEEVIGKLESQFRKQLNIKIINTPQDSVFPDSCFYDTIYHLRSPYHHRHTENVIRHLEKNI
eukprot:GDKJ01005258.1.p1 GENE.GDKJ01005258.1~~GDKJ01005258.1.p1  ORF type:complete len:311 (-),score=13.91 GDKJ01005258.1:1286-2218(-)